jgi:hypothetical protein
MLYLSHHRSAVVTGVFLVLATALSAAEPEAAKAPANPSPAEQVRDKLDQPVDSFKPVEQWTLKDALEWLEDRYAMKFSVDVRAFEAEKIENVRGTLIAEKEQWELKNARLKDVVRKLLAQLPATTSGATHVIIDDTIVVTTTARAPYHWMRQRVSVDSEKEEVSSVLRKLSRETGANLVLDVHAAKDPPTPVTMQVHDVPLETAVSLLSEMAGLKPVRVGNVLFITTKANAQEIRADPDRAHLVGPCPLPPDQSKPATPQPRGEGGGGV